jgi:hypothetical protein
MFLALLLAEKKEHWYYFVGNPRNLVALLHSDSFDELKQGGLHEKNAVATWNFGTTSAFP